MPSYSENQALYLAASGIEIGSIVMVTRKARTGEAGWNNSWVYEMDGRIGSTGTVEDISPSDGIYLAGCWYPFFVIEPFNFSSWAGTCRHYPFLAGQNLTEGEKKKVVAAASRYSSLPSIEFQQIFSLIISKS